MLNAEWVNAVVHEMSSSANMHDAHLRATRVLQSFEAAVRGAVHGEEAGARRDGGDAAGAAAGAGAQTGGGNNTPGTVLEQLARENAMLKKAVTVQHGRAHEATVSHERRVKELQGMCENYQEQLTREQRTNYSLSVHLREAMMQSHSPSMHSIRRNPDVF